jgi:hypothetical protein
MWRNLVFILYAPARTMRGILGNPPDRMVVPLVVLFVVANNLRRFSWAGLEAALSERPLVVGGMMFAGLVVGAIVLVCLFLAFSWLVVVVGRLFGGTGTGREVRSALAWGLTPVIWSLLYRVPLAFFAPAGARPVNISGPDRQSLDLLARGHFGLALVITVLELVVFAWCLVITTFTVSEAHHMSPGNALGTLVLSSLAPLVIVAAAVFAFG